MTVSVSNKEVMVRFLAVGIIGNIIGLAIYGIIYSIVIIEPRAAISWFLSAFVGIWKQHGLHRIFTFRDSKDTYYRSLGKGYMGYSVIIASGTLVHWFIVSYLGIFHYYSWFITKAFNLSFSFLVLRKFVFRTEEESIFDEK